MAYILNIFKEFKKQLLLIYFYILVVQLLHLVEPYVLGKMIDGLLAKEYDWLIAFVIIEFCANIVMFKQMVYDTKIYTSIYNRIIARYLAYSTDSDPSKKIARTDMASEIIHFLEGDVQYYIMAVVSMVGTLFFVFYNDIMTGICITLCVFPVAIIVKYFYKKIAQSTNIGNNQYETKIKILTRGDKSEIDTFFKRRRRILIASSTLQGKNWFSLYSIRSIFLILSIIIYTRYNSSISQGDAVATYSYINNFLHSLMSIPIAVETITRMRDIISRVKTPFYGN